MQFQGYVWVVVLVVVRVRQRVCSGRGGGDVAVEVRVVVRTVPMLVCVCAEMPRAWAKGMDAKGAFCWCACVQMEAKHCTKAAEVAMFRTMKEFRLKQRRNRQLASLPSLPYLLARSTLLDYMITNQNGTHATSGFEMRFSNSYRIPAPKKRKQNTSQIQILSN